MTGLRLIFMGTPEFAVTALRALNDGPHDIVAVYSRPPRRRGRGQAVRESPVQICAEECGLPVRTPAGLTSKEAQEAFAGTHADIAVVAAYGLILPAEILEAPRLGCVNIHASLLPRWRGAAPIQRALMAGDGESGISIMQMDEGLDTGPVLSSERLAIGPDTTAGELHDGLADLGAREIARALEVLASGRAAARPQSEHGVTYARKIQKSETRIDWSQPAPDLHNLVRALSPSPGAWFPVVRSGRTHRVKVLSSRPVPGKGRPGEILDATLTIACGKGALELVRLQREGKSPSDAQAFLRGFELPPETVLE